MQWLFEGSDEAPDCPGLGLLAGRCYRLGATSPAEAGHDVRACRSRFRTSAGTASRMRREASIVDGVPPDAQVYFTHSYVAPVTGDTVAVTEHGEPFAAVVQRGHVAGVQFHPGEVRRRRASGSCATSCELALIDTVSFTCCRNASSPASTSATDRSSRASTSKGCAPPAIRRSWRAATTSKASTSSSSSTSPRRSKRAARWPTRSRAVARELFIPLAVGGGIRTEDDAAAAVDAGADKVSLNTAALANPALITTLAAALRQPGGRRRDRRQAGRRPASPSTRAAARRRPTATPSSGRARPRSAAPARSC